MKLLLQCPLCRFSMNRKSTEEKLFRGKSHSIISNPDDNILSLDCSGMHVSIVCFTNKKFDLLFESGLNAIHDYYYREAVASLATALERFYEYIIRILINDLDFNTINESWKNVANQSERQMGAFIFLYLREFKKLPMTLPNKMIEFRNKVIHKGYFANKEETIRFAEVVLEVINENYSTLVSYKKNEIQEYEKTLKKELKNLAYLKIENEKKYFTDENPWKLVKRPFTRDISTFLSENGIFILRQKSELEKYIIEIKAKTVD